MRQKKGVLRRTAIKDVLEGTPRLPYWNHNMEFDIETWVPYGCDFGPVTTNSLFSDDLGRIAALALRLESEFLYMEMRGGCPVGTLVPENLIRPHVGNGESSSFSMVFSYSQGMEGVLYDLARNGSYFGAGITVCGIWRSSILVDECKVLVVASENPLFNPEEFLDSLGNALLHSKKPQSGNVPYFAEKFGYRRYSIPYETDDVTDLQISQILMNFEFDETRHYVGPLPQLSMDSF
ncbi:MAG: hypothetical protein LBS93_03285 [Synergistaceae bacterium]|nr:hypothetical protein [Synergistaceae bacterium]